MNKIKVGIIGCGKQAPKHIAGLKQIPNVEIVVADIHKELALKLAKQHEVAYADSPSDMLTSNDIDAIDICTPVGTHMDLITESIKNEKDFFCEKPLVETLEEARQLENLLAHSNQIGMVGYIYKFGPVFEKLYEILRLSEGENGVLGRVNVANLRISGRGSHQPWKHMAAQGGGAINEMLVHMVDMAIWLFNGIRNVEVLDCKMFIPERFINDETYRVDAEDYILVKLETIAGVVIYCQADMITPAFTQSLDVQGTNGSFFGSIQSNVPSYMYLNEPRCGFEQGRTDFQFEERNLFVNQFSEFLEAVKSRVAPKRSTVEESRVILEIISKIKEDAHAIRQNRNS